MRFVDSNVFLHAYLRPKRELKPKEKAVKRKAVDVVERLKKGEEAATSTCHLSEVLNILEAGLGLRESLGFLAWVLTGESFKVLEVGRDDYEASLSVAQDQGVSANDALAYMLMTRQGLKEIYSFDKHFDQFNEIRRLP